MSDKMNSIHSVAKWGAELLASAYPVFMKINEDKHNEQMNSRNMGVLYIRRICNSRRSKWHQSITVPLEAEIFNSCAAIASVSQVLLLSGTIDCYARLYKFHQYDVDEKNERWSTRI